jgi:peptide/nickel transport system permease protein
VASTSSDRNIGIKRWGSTVNFVKRLVKEKPLGTIGGLITILLLLVGIFANYLAPYRLNAIHPSDMLQGPSIHYWLGTDNLGRDLLSQVIYGARISMIVGISASLLAEITEVFIGILSGYIGGIFDLIIQRFVDAVLCLPSLILMIAIISITGPGMVTVIIVLGVTMGIGGSRIIRSVTMSARQNLYVKGAEAIGCSTQRVITRHILPNITAPIIIDLSTLLPGVILTEASLSFLGYGVPPPTPSWGGMISGSARVYMFVDPWMVIWPGLALSIVVYGVNMFGDAVRDVLDPRLRGGVGRYGLMTKKGGSIKMKVDKTVQLH